MRASSPESVGLIALRHVLNVGHTYLDGKPPSEIIFWL
jgi:hypothetical protein